MADAEWVRWRPEIAKACDGSHWTIEGIEQHLASGQWRLLTQPGCCYLVEAQRYPTETSCTIWFVAGDIPALVDGLPDVEAWARLNGCSEMLIEGPMGWKRVLQPLGYAPWSITLRKGLAV